MRRARLPFLALVTLVTLAALSRSAWSDPTPLEARARDICHYLKADPTGFDTIFVPAFMAQVGKERLFAITQQTSAQTGPCVSATVTKAGSPLRGEVSFTMEKGMVVPAVMVVEEAAPHLVQSLLLRPPMAQARSLDEIVAKLKTLPGHASLLVQPLDGGKALATLDEERPLAVASSFKLFVLAELGRQVAAGKRKLSDVIVLHDDQRSFSSEYLDKWPKEAPLTLHTVATMMIARSDNTAADMLVAALGPETLEAGLDASGDRHPDGLRPFLTTQQMFRLHLLADDATRARYAKAGVAERRQLLATLRQPLSEVKKNPEKPIAIDTIEWFASTGDLCRVMGALKGMKPTRDALTVNSGIAVDREKWPFVGFKGGSEMGVISSAFLLEDKNGKAFCVAAVWNDTEKDIDKTAFVSLVNAAIQAIP